MKGEARKGRGRFFAGLAIAAVFAISAVVCGIFAVGLDPDTERTWSRVALVAALLTGVCAFLAPPSPVPNPSDTPKNGWLYGMAGAVLLWSLIVRFGFTTPNILTDGGSGFSRILHGSPGFMGLSGLMDLVLPDSRRMDIWSAVYVTTALSALTPALIVLLARELGLPRRAGFLGGLALACLPLHAAIFTSDFILGPAVALMAGGLILISAGYRSSRSWSICAGAAILAYVCWLRPEGVIVFAILLPMLWFYRNRVLGSLIGLVGIGWLFVHVLASFFGHWGSAGPGGSGGPFEVLIFLFREASSPVSMSWFALAFLYGGFLVHTRKLNGRLVIEAGIVFGFVTPLTFLGDELTGSYIEAFRYGTWSLPFLALAAGVAFHELAGVLSGRGAEPPGAEKRPVRGTILVAAALMLVPLLHIPYLQRHYGHASEFPILVEAFGMVPAECGLVVPSDDPQSQGTHEISRLYDELNGGTLRLYGVVEFIERLDHEGRLPNSAPSARHHPPAGAIDCWYFLEAAYCEHGYGDEPMQACSELLSKTEHHLVREWEFEFISHRQVVHLMAPEWDSSARVALFRLGGPSPQSQP